MSTYPGIYRAVVTDDGDPLRLRRLKVQVPAVYGSESSWASACVPAGSRRQPKVGSGVWVMFEAGNPDYPVWMGVVVATAERSGG
jgi:hypothetical protein